MQLEHMVLKLNQMQLEEMAMVGVAG